MSDNTYNGWSNRATWNVSLWLNNDEGTYRELQALVRRAKSQKELAQQIEEFCRAIWPAGVTPDEDRLDDADFDEIAASEMGTEGEPEPTPSTPLSKFVEKHGIKFAAHRVSERPDGLMSENEGQRHFRCQIRKLGFRPSFGLYFSQGSAHTQPPTIEDVLDCLVSDASGYENAAVNTTPQTAFNEWAIEYGYDIDSRAAEKIFKTIERQANQLKRVLGNEAYQELLYKTERL